MVIISHKTSFWQNPFHTLDNWDIIVTLFRRQLRKNNAVFSKHHEPENNKSNSRGFHCSRRNVSRLRVQFITRKPA